MLFGSYPFASQPFATLPNPNGTDIQIGLDLLVYSITNQIIQVNTEQNINTNEISFVLTNNDIQITNELNISEFSYTLTNNDIQIDQNLVIGIQTNNFNLTNYDIQLSKQIDININQQTYNLNYNDIQLIGNINIDIDIQQYLINNIDIQISNQIDIEQIQFNLINEDIHLINNIGIDIQQYLINNNDIQIDSNYNIDIGSQQYLINNNDIQVEFDYNIGLDLFNFSIIPKPVQHTGTVVINIDINEYIWEVNDVGLFTSGTTIYNISQMNYSVSNKPIFTLNWNTEWGHYNLGKRTNTNNKDTHFITNNNTIIDSSKAGNSHYIGFNDQPKYNYNK